MNTKDLSIEQIDRAIEAIRDDIAMLHYAPFGVNIERKRDRLLAEIAALEAEKARRAAK